MDCWLTWRIRGHCKAFRIISLHCPLTCLILFFLGGVGITALQYCITFCYTTKWLSYMYAYFSFPPHPGPPSHCLPPPSHPFRSDRALTELPMLYTWLTLDICFTHGSVYMLIPISQFIPSAPFPLTLVCPSLCLHLCSCPIYRFICTIFLDSTYMQFSLGPKIHTFSSFSFFWHSVQSLSHIRLFATPWIAARQASLSITNTCSLLKLMAIELVIPSSHLILCCPLLLLIPIPPSIRVFSNESTLRIRWPKYWSFSFNISPSNEHPGLTSLRMDWLDLLAVQGTLKNLLQQHSSKH